MASDSVSKARLRAGHLREREHVDGRLVAIGRPHGIPGTYTNYGCRCVDCTTAHSAYLKDQRKKRHEQRVLVDGRLVATEAPFHGRASTYYNWGCRCAQCCSARKDE